MHVQKLVNASFRDSGPPPCFRLQFPGGCPSHYPWPQAGLSVKASFGMAQASGCWCRTGGMCDVEM